MSGTFIVDPATFTSIMFVASAEKSDLKTGEILVNKQGAIKWGVQAVASWQSEYGMPPVTEVITVGIPASHDPASGITAGTQIQFDGMRVGVMAPEPNGKGGIKGGKPFYQASAVRAANGKSSYKPTADTASAA